MDSKQLDQSTTCTEYLNIDCSDPQCGDSTWDHYCESDYRPCGKSLPCPDHLRSNQAARSQGFKEGLEAAAAIFDDEADDTEASIADARHTFRTELVKDLDRVAFVQRNNAARIRALAKIDSILSKAKR